MSTTAAIKIREVGPRDGLQNEPVFVPTATKIKLIHSLIRAGIKYLEVTSFVHPRAVPQLRDAEQVMAGLDMGGQDVFISALVANMHGLERALQASVPEVMLVISASEAHNKANVKMTVQQSLQVLQEMGRTVSGTSTQIRGAVATAFGCPVQGPVSCEQVSLVVEGMLAAGVRAITLADTAGLGEPQQIYDLITTLSRHYPQGDWALHLHDNRGLAQANLLAGISAGVTMLEGSVGGLGGCPVISGAAGNVATEQIVLLLQRMGLETDIDLKSLLHSKHMLEKALGRVFAE